jgi:hypothetical protein
MHLNLTMPAVFHGASVFASDKHAAMHQATWWSG